MLKIVNDNIDTIEELIKKANSSMFKYADTLASLLILRKEYEAAIAKQPMKPVKIKKVG